MSRHAWLTPNTAPSDFICRRLLIPNQEDFLAIVSGCLLALTRDYNFEAFGTSTPQETAEAFRIMFDEFSLDGNCRMIGEIIPYAGTTSPDARWLICDGASLLRADYPDLFAIVGSTYGSVDGSHFNLPDLAGRVPMGAGTGSGLTARSVGDAVGEETHVLTVAEQATHSHLDSGHTHADGNATPTLIAIGAGVPAASAVPSIGVTGSGNANLDSSGSDNPHNNVQPSLVITYLIVALP